MSEYSQKERTFMLDLAKNAICSQLNSTHPDTDAVPPKLKKKRACFVTLTIHGQLRGCIGHIEPVQELYGDIIENAKSAAFHDTRFFPVTTEELKDLTVEISILTIPKPFSHRSIEELLDYLGEKKPGIILSKSAYRATFLPQVWDDLPDPAAFLSALSLKAGLEEDAWKQGVKIELYDVEKITA